VEATVTDGLGARALATLKYVRTPRSHPSYPKTHTLVDLETVLRGLPFKSMRVITPKSSDYESLSLILNWTTLQLTWSIKTIDHLTLSERQIKRNNSTDAISQIHTLLRYRLREALDRRLPTLGLVLRWLLTYAGPWERELSVIRSLENGILFCRTLDKESIHWP